MRDIPNSVEASRWGHAFTLKSTDGTVWGRLLLAEWANPDSADALASRLAAGPDLLRALQAALPHLDQEVEQRKASGNAEYYADIEAATSQVRAAIAKATGAA